MRKQIFNIAVLLLTVIFAFQSCQKEIYDPGLSVDKNLPDIVQQAQVWVKEHSFRSKNATVDYSTLDFDWKAYGIKKNQQGQDVVYIPIANRYQAGKEYMELAFVAKEKVGTLKHYAGDFASEFVQLNFYAIDGKLALSGSFSTKTGKMTTRIALSNKSGKLQKIASSSNNNNGAEGNNTDGFIIDEVPVPPPTQPTWPPVIPPPPSNLPTPPPSGGGGSVPTSPGGGGGYNPPSGGGYGPSDPMYMKRSDCDAVKKANEIALIQQLKNVIDEIKSKSVEYGANIVFNDPTYWGTITTQSVYTNNRPNGITMNGSWSSTAGYTMGFIHNHPSNSAPSPSDIFNASHKLTELKNSTTNQQLTNYIQNYTSMIVSGEYIYTVQIKDANSFSLMKNGFDRDKETNLYTNLVKDYMLRNNIGDDSSIEDLQAAGEYALLRLYGNNIHILKQKIGEINKNKLIKLENNKVIKKEGC